ncbi:hypothetical protein JOB18_010967 [Solea senegalensis]|uniref:Uncharacterized protein n=1 Tax=Solea senegalensis TaxID=28829 RepID=A0AAV6T4N4_SOLSE|nr:hypothetical protein JOB18_010967 [Solea senegalensis]
MFSAKEARSDDEQTAPETVDGVMRLRLPTDLPFSLYVCRKAGEKAEVKRQKIKVEQRGELESKHICLHKERTPLSLRTDPPFLTPFNMKIFRV